MTFSESRSADRTLVATQVVTRADDGSSPSTNDALSNVLLPAEY